VINIYSEGFDFVVKKIQERVSFDNQPEAEHVRTIVKNVREQGNSALIKYINQYECANLVIPDIKVTETELDLAHSRIPDEMLAIFRKAIKNVKAYHEEMKISSWVKDIYDYSKYGAKVTPIRRVGVYVPGGAASYPSSVIMNVVPAQIAGVEEIVMATPCGKDGKVNDATLAIARELGVSEIYRMGGAHAISALAYGTEDADPVDKVVGPGNMFVTLAKKDVFGAVGIDKLAGPSDVCIVADKLSNINYIAADMIAQAEHDPLASAILITDSNDLAVKVKRELEVLLPQFPNREMIESVFQKNSAIFVVPQNGYKEIVNLVNQIAPEHLEIFHGEYTSFLNDIKNAGAIFLGQYSAEVLGDYMLGPNHVLPTGGTARFSSPLSVLDFVKVSSLVIMDRKDFGQLGPDVVKFAELENLKGHALAAKLRM
jgi:histidinol dehydrogenase